MGMNNKLDCPIDHIKVNENKIRVIAFMVAVLAILYLLVPSRIIVLFLLVDFILRIYNLTAYSPLALISDALVKWFKIPNKPVDRGPKRFAAGIGVVFLIAILLTLLFQQQLVSKILAGVLIAFALLESLGGICAGCHVYNLLKQLKLIR